MKAARRIAKRWRRWRLAARLRRRAARLERWAATVRVPEGPADPALPGLAVAAIAVGTRYRAWARVLVHTLRRTGGYAGTVYLLTDAPHEPFGEGVHAIGVPSASHALEVKLLKTWLGALVPAPWVLYLDVDVVVGRPLAPWWRAIGPAPRGAALRVFVDHGQRGGNYHSGVMLLRRGCAVPLLRAWREALLSGRYRYDQPALRGALGDLPVDRLPGGELLFPGASALRAGARATFVHLTFSRCHRDLPAALIADYLAAHFGVAFPCGTGA